MSSILKTGDLIRSIKRRAFIPSSQETFTDEDLLEMATEEINLGLVPLIQRMHEEHLVYYTEIVLDPSKKRYPIPARAHGNKLRDVALVDENDNVFEMHRYSLNELSDFSNTTAYINARGFYLENNDIILTNFQTNFGQKLRIYFYMRPNSLILESNGAVINSVADITEVDKINPISKPISTITPSGSKAIIVCPNHGIENGRKVAISNVILSDLSTFSGVYEISVINSNSFSIGASIALSGTGGTATLMLDVKSLTVDLLPDHMIADQYFDFVQNISPNKIIYYDVRINDVNQSLGIISFAADAIPDIEVGQYVTAAEETFVPNIPTELHPILAQRVAVACLEAMGDEQNKQSAERKLANMEKDAGTFLDNRVEGAQVKIKSRHSPLVNTLNTLGRRNRRW
jgi:hypothetical protein